MKKTSIFLVMLLGFFIVSLTQEEDVVYVFRTGNMLLEKMQKEATSIPEFYDRTYSLGYAVGVWDAYAEIWNISEDIKITTHQVRDVAKKYLEDHPERRHLNAAALLVEAFYDAFPGHPVSLRLYSIKVGWVSIDEWLKTERVK